MSSHGRAKLAVVPAGAPPATAAEPPAELGLYSEVRAAADDRERWRVLHEQSDSSPAINLPGQSRRGIFAMKGGVRRERGGFKFEERN